MLYLILFSFGCPFPASRNNLMNKPFYPAEVCFESLTNIKFSPVLSTCGCDLFAGLVFTLVIYVVENQLGSRKRQAIQTVLKRKYFLAWEARWPHG